MLRLRKNVNSLTAAEKANLVAAIKALKASGKYDQYVKEHRDAMNQATLMPGENPPPPQSFFRNVAHRGPAFGPWHREMLQRFELDLQAEVPGVALPYWDWAADSQLADPKTAPIWGADLMGGDGDPNNTNLVGTGPFRYDPNDPNTWRVVTDPGDPGPGLTRLLGQGAPQLPSQSNIDSVLPITPYDSSPWRTVSDPSFRNQLEGWLGPNLHNRVHVWVGGSMLPGTSPNDPVFFLHHCNVDRLWWQWQIQHPGAGYVPTSGGPPGHNLNDQMSPFGAATTPASTLNIHQLGYYYDTDPPLAVAFILNRNPIGQNEVDARRNQPHGSLRGLPIQDAFRVVVDGFTAVELGLTGPSSTLPTLPVVSPATGIIISPSTPIANTSDNGDYGPEIQRFTFYYDIDFSDGTDPAFSFGGQTEDLTLSLTVGGVPASALLTLIKQPDPFLLHGDPAWLSVDLRDFVVRAGADMFGVPGVTGASDAPRFIQQLMATITPAQFDSLSPVEDQSKLYLQPKDENQVPVFNFALAKVHYIGLIGATNVRVFFRLRQTQVTYAAYDYPPGAQYRRATSHGQPIALAGIVGNEYVTVPCFAEGRVDSTTVGMDQQPDDHNVRTITAHADGSEVDTIFGCWIDINQPDPRLPVEVPPKQDGPFDVNDPNPNFRPVSLKEALARNLHLCLIAEINFDPTPIPLGKDPSNWDKLAQRNIAWSDSGSAQSVTTFEIRPTPMGLPAGQTPDELMIDWGNTPKDRVASIHLPAVSVDDILAMATRMYTSHRLVRADDHTLQCKTGGITYVPIPPGSNINYAGLLSVDLPDHLRRGEVYTVAVRQVTNAFGEVIPPPKIAARAAAAGAAVAAPAEIEWRQVLGAFQLTIPVHAKASLLLREERDLSVLLWIAEAIPHHSRWYPVFRRYLELIKGRVKSFGGDPGQILPSPTGEGRVKPRPPERPGEERVAYTGKIAGLIFDRFGDFEGFLLDTEDGERKYLSREKEIELLAERAWRERLRITVCAERHCPHRPECIIVREPPAPFEH